MTSTQKLKEPSERTIVVPLAADQVQQLDAWLKDNWWGIQERGAGIRQLLLMGLDADRDTPMACRPEVGPPVGGTVVVGLDEHLNTRLDRWVASNQLGIDSQPEAVAALVAFALSFNDDGSLPPIISSL